MRLRLGDVEHDLTTHPLVMGVLGGSPPVVVNGGVTALDVWLGRAEELVREGADLLDVGGMGAGPGPPVGEQEELDCVVPAVQALRARLDVPLAIDTWRARVLAESCAAGATAGRDTSGFVDPGYLPVAAEAGATVIIPHTRLPGRTEDVVAEVRRSLAGLVGRANGSGIADDRIVVDAGLGLGKSPAQSLTLLREIAALADLGPPLLVSASDKRLLDLDSDLDAGAQRMAGHAAAALAIARGCRIVRASDVRGAKRVTLVLEALLTARLAHVVGAEPG